MLIDHNNINTENIELLEKLIESIPVAIIIFKDDQLYTCNQAYLNYIDPKIAPFCKPGLSLLDFLEMIYSQMQGVQTDDPAMDELHKTDKNAWILERKKGYRENNTSEVLDHDGWWRIIDRYYPNSDIYVGIRIDIRDLKEAELRAEAAGLAKSQFLANMSHEIRTPMNGIMGMAELLSNSDLPPRQRDFANIIMRSGSALLAIINDILDFSKIEAGQLSLSHEPFILRDCLEDITTLLAPKVAETGIDLLLRLQPDLPNCYVGDVGRIRQVLMNIIGNAVKFTHEGYVVIDIEGVCNRGLASLTFNIKDTGIGIEEDKLKAIFNKFTQADSSTTREFGGTGLGLNIAQELVNLMGGDIKVMSEVARGSSFTFTIELPVTENLKKTSFNDVDITGSKILVIDDNEVNCKILKEQLDYWRCNSIAVNSALKGVSVLKKLEEKGTTLDLIIVDYQMPKNSGEDFVRAIKKHEKFKEIPVIMLSSVDTRDLQDRMSGLAISTFLTKPARASALLNAINDTTYSKRASQSYRGLDINLSSAHKNNKAHTLSKDLTSDFSQKTAVDILIAEDNEVNQMYAKYLLEDLGLSFEIVPNGRAAVAKWKSLSPKMILMDISMPEMNGYEATAEIRKIESNLGLPRTPIIAVTAHSMPEDEETCLKNDMDGYLSKPMAIASLKACLEEWNANDHKHQKIAG